MSKQKAPFSILNYLYKEYHKDAGKMLIHTGTIGWILSSAAQMFGIMMNEKIPKEQKMFLIPQEFADACFNIMSFYLVTRSFTGAVNKLINSGKFIPKYTKDYLVKHNFSRKIGTYDFDISKVLPAKQNRSFNFFKNGMGVIAMTIGSIISCNIITPLFRNRYASVRQKQNIAKLNNPNPAWQNPKTPREMARAVIHHTYMQAFMNRGDLKI